LGDALEKLVADGGTIGLNLNYSILLVLVFGEDLKDEGLFLNRPFDQIA
jgi:hypothetical protein